MNRKLKLNIQKLSLATLLAVAFPCVTIAAEKSTEVEGLPQLDFTTYTPQLFWMFAFFTLLYIVFAKKTLPEISGVIENRKNHIQSDLETAEKLTAEADAVHDAYQENLAKAQSDAMGAIKSVEDESKAQANQAMEDFRQKSEATILATEKTIDESKQTAMNDMNQIVIDTAAQAVEKIIGLKADPSKLSHIVQNMGASDAPSSKKPKAA
jgi:F-type H+-transporting ATPase subunit b